MDLMNPATDSDLEPIAAVIDLDDPDAAVLDALRSTYAIHELAIEDAYEAHQRPKLELFGPVISLVIKTTEYDDVNEQIDFGELLMLIGSDFLISVRHGHATGLPSTLDFLPDDRRFLTPVAAAHRVVDFVTDQYEPVMAAVEFDVYEIERDVFSADRTNPAERIYRLKRQVLELRRNVGPLLPALDRLANDSKLGIGEELQRYYRDVEDHLRLLVGRIEQTDALLTDVLNANLAHISVQQNADMRRMSAWALIFLVPTLLAGVWGMNFQDMPEIHWSFGYPAALAIMVVASGGLYVRLRKAGWL